MFTEITRNKIEEKFKSLVEEVKYMMDIEERLKKYEEDLVLAIKYLYISMPYSDIGNYSFDTFLDFARHGVYLWREGQYKDTIPEDIFLNYVLHHRVNEEEIAPCRSLFYEKLKERVRGLTMKEAILEVNYWCCEEVTYQSTDNRTMSAIDVYNLGYGRCGEESTFTVNALRSIGIPARQVYAPKWSHCDDNHAWVEAFYEGEWHFIGACEPEEILNKGWFTNAASRAMIIHSRWFEDTTPKEVIIGKKGMNTMLNQTARYARDKEITIVVLDEEKNPIQGAIVDLEVLNYSEFASIATITTKKDGVAKISLGLGSIHIHVRKGNLVGEALLDTRKVTEYTIVLSRSFKAEKGWKEFDFIAPKDYPINIDKPTEKQKNVGREKYIRATNKRLEKVKNIRRVEEEVFLGEDNNRYYREALLSSISVKDRDTLKAEVLEEHLSYALSYKDKFPYDIFINYLLNPRVKDEPITRYREYILSYFTNEDLERFKNMPLEIWGWICKNIKSREEKEGGNILTTPVGSLKIGASALSSKKILFVSMARTCGIPARLNEKDGAIEYLDKGEFVSINKEDEKTSTIIFRGEDANAIWKYKQNWSISYFEEGSFSTLNLEGEEWIDNELKIKVKPGRYKLITSNRLPNGNIFAKQCTVNIGNNDKQEIILSLREANLEDMLENIVLDEFYLKNERLEAISAASLCKDGKKVLLWLEEGKEPTEHILNELIEGEDEIKKYIKNFIFIIRNKEDLGDSTLSKVIKALDNVQIYYDDFQENVQTLGRRMYLDPDKLPLIIVTNNGLNGIYGNSGYNVGIGDTLIRILRGPLI